MRGKQEGRAPDRGERDEAARNRRPSFLVGFSSSRSRFFRAMPQGVAAEPAVGTHRAVAGTTSATGLAPQALPTARTAAGLPMARAISP